MSTRIAAAFDALVIASALGHSANGAAATELQTFAYLSCLVSIYAGSPAADWAYDFAATPAGAPYSQTLDREIERLRASGRLLARDALLVLSDVGADELAALRSFPSLSVRAPHLDAACAVATLQPLPSIADALAQEPQLQEALRLNSSRELLTEGGLLLLERHFNALREVLDERGSTPADPIVPAAVWLAYLSALAQAAAGDAIARHANEELDEWT